MMGDGDESFSGFGWSGWILALSEKNYYIFGAGVWIGCIDQEETLVTIGYDLNSQATEFNPTLGRYLRRKGGNGPEVRIYKHPGDWPPPRDWFSNGTNSTLGRYGFMVLFF